jgi:preprotein translocase subunit SecE
MPSVAQTRSQQSNSARTGPNREQARRGGAVGTGSPRPRGTATVSPAPRPPMPMPSGGAGGRRGRGNPLNFIRDVRSELRKVSWPSQRETINLTAVVLAFSIAVGLFLGGVDFLFQELFRFLLGVQGG